MRRIVIVITALLGMISQVCAGQVQIHKRVLENGLTVLVVPRPHTPDVAVQLYYRVGSRDENVHEKGLAHLLEHMVFKGTQELLSETDILATAQKLSGSCNAFTSYDYTAYVFTLPTRYWHEALPILADCMTNCTFKQDILNAEFKTVIQELKMRHNECGRALFQELLTSAFPGHPYHYPVIGYTHDIAQVNSADLHAFYRKHYMPNNAVLLIVGDVQPEQACMAVAQSFDAIPAGTRITRKKYTHTDSFVSRSSCIYHDIKQPQAIIAYKIPGITQTSLSADILGHVLAGNTSSRLHKRIVEQERCAVDISCYIQELEDVSLLTFPVTLTDTSTDVSALERIQRILDEELHHIAINGLLPEELLAFKNLGRSVIAQRLEHNPGLARAIALQFLATGDEQYPIDLMNTFAQKIHEGLNTDIKHFVTQYCRRSQQQSVVALPLSEPDRKHWGEHLQKSCQEDMNILHARIRTSDVEPARYAHTRATTPLTITQVCVPQEFTLSNGLHIIAYHNPTAAKILVQLQLKTQKAHVSRIESKIYGALAGLLVRGTEKYTVSAFSDAITHAGAGVQVEPGVVTANMFPEDLERVLAIVTSMLTEPLLAQEELDQVKTLARSDVQAFYQQPANIATHIIQKTLYERELMLNMQQDLQEFADISRDSMVELYRRVISPHDAYMIVVGNLEGQNLPELLEKTVGTWQGERVEVPAPRTEYQPVVQHTVEYPLDRDQVVIALGTHSVSRSHPDFQALMLADAILFGGMNSRLFNIRQETGMFYHAHGCLAGGASTHEPGIVLLTTMVAPDKVAVAEQLLRGLLDSFADTLTDEEVACAKNALWDKLGRSYATNDAIMSTLNALKMYQEPWDAVLHKVAQYNAITTDQIRHAVRRLLEGKEFIHVRVGPVGARTS